MDSTTEPQAPEFIYFSDSFGAVEEVYYEKFIRNDALSAIFICYNSLYFIMFVESSTTSISWLHNKPIKFKAKQKQTSKNSFVNCSW